MIAYRNNRSLSAVDPQMPDSGNQPIAAGAANLGYITPQYSYGPPTQQQWQFQQQQHFNQWNAERNAQMARDQANRYLAQIASAQQQIAHVQQQ